MARRGRKKSPFKLKLRVETLYSIGSLALLAIGGLLVVSFSGQGHLLQSINNFLRELFGVTALIVPFLFISAGLVLTGAKWSFAKPQVLLGACLLVLSLATIGETGSLGADMFTNVSSLIQPLGTYFVFSIIAVAAMLIMTDTSIREVFGFLASAIEIKPSEGSEKGMEKIDLTGKQGDFKVRGGQMQKNEEAANEKGAGDKGAKDDKGLAINKKQVTVAKPGAADELPPKTLLNAPGDQQIWQYPPVAILDHKSGGQADRGNVNANASIIEKTLESFGIRAKVREVNLGPAVTQYALEISLGTKLSKITSLANDLALALAAPTGQIRIEAPIPGRSYVGIEIPNRSPEFVPMRTMLTSDQMKKVASKLAVPLGLNVAGEPVVADIGKMPHVLVAGATGSGKSVAINSFISSILFRASPNEVKFILVDPKRVELTQYNDIPHLLTPVIVEPPKVLAALRWATGEMERRYKTFAEVGVRNIGAYNELAGFQALPYIVIIIDELADIMLFAPADVEEAITRIAQMARATGMHLVLATQRPSVDVITGLIKANIPTRIAFAVASMMDSRVVLDSPGAEKLLGRGDMLYIPPDQAKPTRIQGTFISDREIHGLIDFLKKSGIQPQYQEEVTTKFVNNKVGARGGTGGTGNDDHDELFDEAVKIVVEYDRASASVLQRRLSVGYSRAARIIDQLFEAGIVGAQDGSKPREVNSKAAQEYLNPQGNTNVAEDEE
jgi:S-DNA-T family DNA segregation ATPase FtsK/SpoIIIE